MPITDTWLREHKYHKISGADQDIANGTKYQREISLDVAPTLDTHISVTFELAALNRFDIHGTIRTRKDSAGLWKTKDQTKVSAAIWVYHDKTFRTGKNTKLSYWLTSDGGITYSVLKSLCRKLAEAVKNEAVAIEREGAEWLENTHDACAKIDTLGVAIKTKETT